MQYIDGVNDALTMINKKAQAREYDVLCKNIQEFSDKFPDFEHQCAEYIYQLLAKRQNLLIENEAAKCEDYNALYKSIQNFAIKHDALKQPFGELLHSLLMKRHDFFIKNPSSYSYKEILKALIDFSVNYPEIMPHQTCGNLIFQALDRMLLKFIDQRYKSAKEYDELFDAIKDFSKSYENFALECAQLTEKLEGVLLKLDKPNETKQMKQFQEEKKQEIKQLKKDYKQGIEKIAREKDIKIQELQEKLNNALESTRIMKNEAIFQKNLEIDQLKVEYKNDISEKDHQIQEWKNKWNKEKAVGENLLSIKDANSKLLSGLVKTLSISTLEEKFLENPDQDLESLCLIPFSHKLKDLETLQEKGAILTWSQLYETLELSKKIDVPRRYLKRLREGVEQLLATWPKNQLQNQEVKAELDKHLLKILREDLENLKQCPEIEKELTTIRQKEIIKWLPYKNDFILYHLSKEWRKQLNEVDEWFQNGDDLSNECHEAFDEFVCDHLLKTWWLDNPEEKPSLFSTSLEENKKIILLNKFKANELELENFQNALNQDILTASIFELGKAPTSKGNQALQNMLKVEMNLIQKENQGNCTYNRLTLLEKAAEKISLKWFKFKGEISDQFVVETLDNMAKDILGKVSMDNQGQLHTMIQREAAHLLLKQLRKGQLILIEEPLIEEIIKVLPGIKPTHAQQEDVIRKVVLEKFKTGDLNDEDQKKCLSILQDHLDRLNERLGMEKKSEFHFKFFRDSEKDQLSEQNSEHSNIYN